MKRPSTPHVSIVIPAYNEAGAIGPVLDQIIALDLGAEIIVVNDGSTDATSDVAGSRKGVRVIEHPYNIGNGASIKTGIRAAHGDVILMMDGDGQHKPADIPRLLGHMKRYDMVVGARTSESDAQVHRTFANQVYNTFASYIVAHKVEDLTSGFRAVRGPIARSFWYLLPNGFSYPTTLTLALFRGGFSVRYEPIVSPARTGKSKIKLVQDGPGFLLTMMRIATVFSPMKIFLPVTLALLAPGALYMTYSLAALHRFSSTSGIVILTGVFLFMLGLIAEQIALLRMSQIGHFYNEIAYPAPSDDESVRTHAGH
jgi:glycosyltransferase involved in cell wall biosynthesis